MSADDIIAQALIVGTIGDSGRIQPRIADRLADAVLAALESAGFAVVELPVAEDDGDGPYFQTAESSVWIDEHGLNEDDRRWYQVEDARTLAAALLAAANAAEGLS